MSKIGYGLIIDDNIKALSYNREIVDAYKEVKDGMGEVKLIEGKSFKKLIRELEHLELEETEYGIPLTNEEVRYLDQTMGEVNEISRSAIKAIRRAINHVEIEDVKKLISAVKVLNKYTTPKKAFRTMSSLEMASEMYVDGDNNIVREHLKILDQSKEIGGKGNE